MSEMNNNEQTLKLIGKKIRLLRKKAGMSITDFAGKVGVTSAYISQIERDLIEPSLVVLRKIAKHLDIELPLLFADEIPTDVLVSTIDKKAEIKFIGGFAKFRLLMPSRLKNGERPSMLTMTVRIGAGLSDSDEYVSHNHVEFCYVLTGEIYYITEKNEYRLNKGDSIYIYKDIPHMLCNKSENEAVLLAAFGSATSRFISN